MRSDMGSCRYFKGMRIDYPNNDTSKGSKKYVNCMKKLDVSTFVMKGYPPMSNMSSGDYSPNQQFSKAVLGPFEENIYI